MRLRAHEAAILRRRNAETDHSVCIFRVGTSTVVAARMNRLARFTSYEMGRRRGDAAGTTIRRMRRSNLVV
jgi:hypothetical protein